MLTSIDVKFIFDSSPLGLFGSANILLLANVAFRVVFLLFLSCFWLLFRLVLTLGMSEMSAIFVFTTKTTQPHPQVFLVNDALTCRKLHFWHHRFINRKILPNFVICSRLWWINAWAFDQSELGKYFERIIVIIIMIITVITNYFIIMVTICYKKA